MHPIIPLPRYRLKVGQVLTYREQSTFHHPGGTLTDDWYQQVWVVAHNQDNSYELIVRKVTAWSPVARVVTARFDLFPEGHIRLHGDPGQHFDPAELFIKLPADSAEMRQGWAQEDPRLDLCRTYGYHALAEAPTADTQESQRFNIQLQWRSLTDAVYGTTSSAQAFFDQQQGLVTLLETQKQQLRGCPGQGHTKLRLIDIIEQDKAWIKQFRDDLGCFLQAEQRYQQLNQQAVTDHSHCEQHLQNAAEILESGLRQVNLEEVQNQFVELLDNHQDVAKHSRQEADDRAAIINQPAPNVITSDFEGQQYSLNQYRGQVVLLDFWYWGCAWCIRTHPRIKQLVTRFRGQPVVILGMNVDLDPDNAQLVIDKMGLSYPQLKARRFRKAYRVHIYPTLVLIDKQGIIRQIHTCFHPEMAETIGTEIEQWLTDLIPGAKDKTCSSENMM